MLIVIILCKISRFLCFARLAWNCLFTPPFGGVFGALTPNEFRYCRSRQKDHPWVKTRMSHKPWNPWVRPGHVSRKKQYNQVTNEEKHSEETKTLHAGCSKVEPKILAPPQTPFLGTRNGQNLISWRWLLPLHTNPVWWGSMHAVLSYHGNWPTNAPTNTHTHKPTDRTDYNTLCRSFADAQCNNEKSHKTVISEEKPSLNGLKWKFALVYLGV